MPRLFVKRNLIWPLNVTHKVKSKFISESRYSIISEQPPSSTPEGSKSFQNYTQKNSTDEVGLIETTKKFGNMQTPVLIKRKLSLMTLK